MIRRTLIALSVSLMLASSGWAQAAKKAANATAQCKDGTYSTAKTQRGACSAHGGVATWYGADAKSEAKAAEKDASKAAKETGKAVAQGAKTVAGATKQGAKTAAKETKAASKAAAAPADATGQCKDGTYTTAKSQRGACSGHGGVAKWMADAGASAPSAPPATANAAPAPAPRTAPPPAPRPTPPPAATANPPAAGNTPATGSSKIVAPPPDAPPDATAQCNDGTFSKAKQHRGACSGHKGVKAWFK